MNAATFYKLATGHAEPYPYQVRLAENWEDIQVVDVPTGLGKTEGLLSAWLYQLYEGGTQTRMAYRLPGCTLAEQYEGGTQTRLAYCLPGRTLVEQTAKVAQACIQRVTPLFEEKGLPIPTVHIMMGGQADDAWERYPEHPAIIVGTQDMLISRALNRPYGMSLNKARVHLGLMSNDVCWVFDEVQIMYESLETSAQLQYLRDKMGTLLPSRSIWVSATMDVQRLNTVDQQQPLKVLTLEAEDLAQPAVQTLLAAPKALKVTKFVVPKSWKNADDIRKYASLILKSHVSGTKTVVYVNQKRRAQLLVRVLQVQIKKSKQNTTLLLVHGSFRPVEREEQLRALEQMVEGIVVSTQALEAGVDFSAQTLLTEVAPWSSLVQRFGRCNRDGRDSNAKVFVIPMVYSETTAPPYDQKELALSLKLLKGLKDCSPQSLQTIKAPHTETFSAPPRRKDLVDLFDTSPDFAGNIQDVSSYIRDTEDDQNVLVYWRELQKDDSGVKRPSQDEDPPRRSEICPVSLWDIRKFSSPKWKQNWEGEWYVADPRNIIPGDRLLLDAACGGYSVEEGWTGKSEGPVPIPSLPPRATRDFPKPTEWVSLVDHTEALLVEFRQLLSRIPALKVWEEVIFEAILQHDAGKAYSLQQERYRAEQCPDPSIQVVAKSPHLDRHPKRKMQRHELISALIYLQEHARSGKVTRPYGTVYYSLVAWLVASHHGQVGMSLRPRRNESIPPHTTHYALGVWDGDEIPGVTLPRGRFIKPCKIDLHSGIMGLGEGSWRERMVDLRDQVSIYVLSYLEAIVRVADWRASEKHEKEKRNA